MQRDMDLIRQILISVEQDKHLSNASAIRLGYDPEEAEAQPDIPAIEGYCVEEVGHHCYLLEQAGLLTAWKQGSGFDTAPFVTPHCLTWEGHEFLANIREESQWDTIKQQVGNASFEILKTAALSMAKSTFGLG